MVMAFFFCLVGVVVLGLVGFALVLRERGVLWRLWASYPNRPYVAPPDKWADWKRYQPALYAEKMAMLQAHTLVSSSWEGHDDCSCGHKRILHGDWDSTGACAATDCICPHFIDKVWETYQAKQWSLTVPEGRDDTP